MTSKLEQKARQYLAYFDTLDVQGFLSMLSPSCTFHYPPATTGFPPLDKAGFEQHMSRIHSCFSRFSMQIKEIHINEEKKQVTMWAQSEIRMREELKEDGMEVDDLGNEYMYLLSFDEAGEKLTKVVEFMDSLRVQQLKVVFFKALENLAKIEEKADRSQ